MNRCLLTTVQSDSHMWNLMYMQLWLEEHGFDTLNLGCCVSTEETILSIEQFRPELVVISSLNGHGYSQGKGLIGAIKQYFDQSPIVVIGGKLSTHISDNELITTELTSDGYDGVFVGANAIEEFECFVKALKLKRSALKAAS